MEACCYVQCFRLQTDILFCLPLICGRSVQWLMPMPAPRITMLIFLSGSSSLETDGETRKQSYSVKFLDHRTGLKGCCYRGICWIQVHSSENSSSDGTTGLKVENHWLRFKEVSLFEKSFLLMFVVLQCLPFAKKKDCKFFALESVILKIAVIATS